MPPPVGACRAGFGAHTGKEGTLAHGCVGYVLCLGFLNSFTEIQLTDHTVRWFAGEVRVRGL